MSLKKVLRYGDAENKALEVSARKMYFKNQKFAFFLKKILHILPAVHEELSSVERPVPRLENLLIVLINERKREAKI